MFEGISISAADKQAAIDAISPGGVWSPENVAGNILNMAKALSGGDVSKLGNIKKCCNKKDFKLLKKNGAANCQVLQMKHTI